jgi:hypothetical protein
MRLANETDIDFYAEHMLRLIGTSGVAGVPFFTAREAREFLFSDVKKMTLQVLGNFLFRVPTGNERSWFLKI